MLHFTCHPVNDYCTESLYNCASPDWCGVLAEELQKKLNIRTVPSALNGCCGNINPHDPYEPDLVLNSERMVNALAALAERITLSMSFDNSQNSAVINYMYTEVPMTYVTHCAKKYVGYMSPERSFAYNAHETHYNRTYRAKLAPGSIEMARDAALAAIDKLFG